MPGPAARAGRRSLASLVGARRVELVGRSRLKRNVLRLRLVADGRPVGLVLKRVAVPTAKRWELLARTWLPAIGLEEAGPPLLRVVADARPGQAWLVCEDLGETTVATDPLDRAQVAAVIRVVAELHLRFADHPLLREARRFASDRGGEFFAASVAEARQSLAELDGESRRAVPSAVLRRLLSRLERLEVERDHRLALLAEHGSRTLVHGDLWATNAVPVAGAWGVRLIDWDHCGPGHGSYDLSAFLLRFPARERAWIMDLYEERLRAGGAPVPSREVWNALFETAEAARMASCVGWAARELAGGEVGWGADRLAAIDDWFERLAPVLPFARTV